MKMQTKLLLAGGGVLVLAAAISLLVSYHQFKADMQADMAREAGNVRAMLMATRRVYHQQFLASGLPVNDATVGFLPAFALSRISKDFANWSNSGLYFNNVSDLPRNPGNQADASELEAMDWFRANAEAKERIAEITAADGKHYYHYTAPIRIEEYCLKCHGDPASAPESIRNRYSEAFGYKVGDLRGVTSIKIPMEPYKVHIMTALRNNLLGWLAGIAVLLVILGLLINRLVADRLLNLEKTAAALAKGDYTQRSLLKGNDEVASLSVILNHMAEQVERRDNDLQRFAEVSSHHLQEPARLISTYAERLKQQIADRRDDDEARLSLEVINQQARHQQHLLRDVERYLSADQPRGEVKLTDAGKTVAMLLERLAKQIEESGVQVVVGELPAAWIDAPRLTDLFEGVLENALQFGDSPANRPLRITLEGLRDKTVIRYRICDNGPGIEAQYRERVFRVFERLRSEGEGTGIGLAIVRRIAESCGGRAYIEEAQGGGCCVVIELKSPPQSGEAGVAGTPSENKDLS